MTMEFHDGIGALLKRHMREREREIKRKGRVIERLREEEGERKSAGHHMRAQQEDRHMQARRGACTRKGLGQHLDLGLLACL